MNTIAYLTDKINNPKDLDFGSILSKSFELFKKTWVQGFILILIIFITLIPFFMAIYWPIYSSVFEQMQNGDYDPNDINDLMLGQSDNFRFTILGLTFIISFISIILVAGFYNIIKKIDFNEAYKSSDFFTFFKGKYLGKVFTIASLSLLISLLNFALEKFLPPFPASIVTIVLSVWFSVYSTLFVVFFAFNPHLNSSEIFNLSFNLGTKKWALIFGLLIVSTIIGCFGLIGCGVGILLTISIIYLPPYLIYKDIIGFDEMGQIEQIEH